MKTMILLILLGVFVSPIALKAQDQQKSLYQKKVISYTKMKRIGVGLTIGGLVLSVAGVALMADGANKTYSYDIYEDGSGEFLLGYLTTCVGVGATSGGIALWAIGGSKKNKYTQKMNSLSLNLNPNHYQVFSLAYRF